MAFYKLVIFFIFLYIIPNNEVLFSQVNNEITIDENNLYIGTTKIIGLDENDRRIYIREFEQYIIIQIRPNVYKPANMIIYNKSTNHFLLLNTSLYDKKYYWNGHVIYRRNSKIGKWALVDLQDGTEDLIEHWIATLYLVNNELCILSPDGFISIINNNRYNKNAFNIEILPIDFDYDSPHMSLTGDAKMNDIRFEEMR